MRANDQIKKVNKKINFFEGIIKEFFESHGYTCTRVSILRSAPGVQIFDIGMLRIFLTSKQRQREIIDIIFLFIVDIFDSLEDVKFHVLGWGIIRWRTLLIDHRKYIYHSLEIKIKERLKI